MPEHPSLEGLQAHVAEALRTRWKDFENAHGEAMPMATAGVALQAAAEYLERWDVLQFGGGLLRVRLQHDAFVHAEAGYTMGIPFGSSHERGDAYCSSGKLHADDGDLFQLIPVEESWS